MDKQLYINNRGEVSSKKRECIETLLKIAGGLCLVGIVGILLCSSCGDSSHYNGKSPEKATKVELEKGFNKY